MRTQLKPVACEGQDLDGAYSVPDFCAAYGVKKTLVYDFIAQKKLRAVHAGRRTLILKRDAQAWANGLPAVGAA